MISPVLVLFLLALGGAAYYFFFYEDPFTIAEHESRTGDSPGRLAINPNDSTTHSPTSPDEEAETSPLDDGGTVTIWLEITPPNAVVLWNGEPLEARPLVVGRSDKPGVLRVSAPGHVTQKRRIKSTAEQTLKFRLKRKGTNKRGGARR
ncbi:MAG: hypothetical protein JRF63_11040 [Deltaproteobacteria bacterium]|nr:hypothetical protein [Deltaproteobacteria bacterium]